MCDVDNKVGLGSQLDSSPVYKHLALGLQLVGGGEGGARRPGLGLKIHVQSHVLDLKARVVDEDKDLVHWR